MSAAPTTKFQVNYKLADGTLINIYADNVRELEAGLADIAMNALNIITTGRELSQGSVAPAAVSPAVSAIAAQFKETPVAPVAAPPIAGNSCQHGPMTFKTGVSAKGPWSGWMCSTPKGAPDKCDTIWVRQQMREPKDYEAPSCAQIGGDFWFPDVKEIESFANIKFAKSVCNTCPHKSECAEWGIANEVHGIWGGLTNKDRDLIARIKEMERKNIA